MSYKLDQANVLKIAAVAIAAPRWVGAFAAAIGMDALSQYKLLADAEALSGGAMALLEGFAIAYVLGKWRELKPSSYQWWTLLTFSLLLTATLPLVATPYLLVEQDNSSIGELFEQARGLQIAWSVLVAAVPMLVIMAVGFADSDSRLSATITKPLPVTTELLANLAISTDKPELPLVTTAHLNGKPLLTTACPRCGKGFATKQALGGHSRYCKE